MSGFKWVPVEPTEAMLQAGINTPCALTGDDSVDEPQDYRNVYAAMLAAAPATTCPGHGRPECATCCWPARAAYTAVDMTTAAADGYRDGKSQFVVTLPRGESLARRMYGPPASGINPLISRQEAIGAIEAAGGSVAP